MNDHQAQPDGPPLAGVHVLDITANMSGPFGTMILGDQGADVIKLEPIEGDPMRNVGSGSAGLSGYFANLNRSKRCLAMDLTHPDARPIFEALLDWSDVVVHNYRPAAATTIGIDADTVRSGRERLIHVTVVGYGTTGPFAGRPAYDQVIQALSGFGARQAEGDGEPRLVRHGIIDKLTGMTLAQAVSSALVRQVRDGTGRSIVIAMLDVAVSVLWPDGMMNHTVLEPDRSLPEISNGFRLTATSDGHIAFALATVKQLRNLRRAIGLDDDRDESTDGSMRRAGAVMREASERLAALTTDDAVSLLAEHDVPVAPLVGLADLHLHPQIAANGTIGSLDHPVLGTLRQANPLVRFTDETVADLRPAGRLGEHGPAILAALGIEPDVVEDLCRNGVVLAPELPGPVRRASANAH